MACYPKKPGKIQHCPRDCLLPIIRATRYPFTWLKPICLAAGRMSLQKGGYCMLSFAQEGSMCAEQP